MKKPYFSPQLQINTVQDHDVISTSIGVEKTGNDWTADWSDRTDGTGQL
ncbi:MAG: hypothetical protein SOZ51_05000 [Eubacteriales bacterium]|nr:hypothetical protein [Eubacteriales bacterium]